jgi:hypothetical protein
MDMDGYALHKQTKQSRSQFTLISTLIGSKRLKLNGHWFITENQFKRPAMEGWMDHLPLLQAPEALRVELLDGDDDAGVALGWIERALVDPALVDRAEAALPEHHLRLQPARGHPQLGERELPQPRRFQNPPETRALVRTVSSSLLLLRSPAVARLRRRQRPCTCTKASNDQTWVRRSRTTSRTAADGVAAENQPRTRSETRS